MHAQLNVSSYDKRTDIQRRSVCRGYPLLLNADQRLECVKHVVLVKLRNTQTLVGAVHTLEVLIGTEKLDLSVIDVSFISLKIVLPAIKALLKPTGQVLCLIKPQFEAGKEKVTYVKMDADKAKKVVADHIKGGKIVTDYVIGNK